MKKILFILAALLLLILLGFFGYKQIFGVHESLKKGKADFSIESEYLYQAFDQNEKEANDKYLNKVLDVTGKIVDVKQKDENIKVILSGGDMGAVTAVLVDTESMDAYTKGQEITVRCKCSGYLMDVVLNRCEILDK